MADDLTSFLKFPHWSRLLTAVGPAIILASIPMSFWAGVWIGLGLLSLGIGEWLNRPGKKQKQTVEGLSGFHTMDAYPWEFNLLGVVADVAGFALFGFGLYLAWKSAVI